jgi:hypothetical protein
MARVSASVLLIARIVPGLASGSTSLDVLSPTGGHETRSLAGSFRKNTAESSKWLEPALATTEFPAKDDPLFFQFLRKDTVAYLRVATIRKKDARKKWTSIGRCVNTSQSMMKPIVRCNCARIDPGEKSAVFMKGRGQCALQSTSTESCQLTRC